MTDRHWPLYGLRLITPRLELRLPGTHLLDELADAAARGVHPPEEMPFGHPWTDAEPVQRGRGVVQHVLATIAQWRPEAWRLSLAVLLRNDGNSEDESHPNGKGDGDGNDDGDGNRARRPRVVGRQDIGAHDFAVLGEAHTGSWLELAHQGQGLGTEMRAAVTHLAFAGLGARAVTSEAMVDNPRSCGVSRRIGYRDNGTSSVAVRGEARPLIHFRLDRASWEAHRTTEVEIRGLAKCREMFGVPDEAPAVAPAE